MSLLHAALREVGPEGLPVDLVVAKSEQAAEARGLTGWSSPCVDGADPFPAAPRRLSGRSFRPVGGGLRGPLDRHALVDRLHHVAQGG